MHLLHDALDRLYDALQPLPRIRWQFLRLMVKMFPRRWHMRPLPGTKRRSRLRPPRFTIEDLRAWEFDIAKILEAEDAVRDFERTEPRIDDTGFYRRIMPPLPVSNDELDRKADTDKPVAVSIPFATLPQKPQNLYIRGPRYSIFTDPNVRWRDPDDPTPKREGAIGIMDDEMAFKLPDGTIMEWDGDPLFLQRVEEEFERQKKGKPQ